VWPWGKRDGRRSDAEFEFSSAYARFLDEARARESEGDREGALRLRVRAAQAIEKAQDWRAQSALWESIGDRLGEEIEPAFRSRHPQETGQSDMFHIISLEGWERISTQYDAPEDAQRHRQAFAYMWAAGAAESSAQFDLASRL
jgi:hypothetical protein